MPQVDAIALPKERRCYHQFLTYLLRAGKQVRRIGMEICDPIHPRRCIGIMRILTAEQLYA